jgi:hypothetical protein
MKNYETLQVHSIHGVISGAFHSWRYIKGDDRWLFHGNIIKKILTDMVKNMMDDRRINDLRDFYSILNVLAEKTGLRSLSKCSGKLLWPERGVYFFMEDGESRSDSGIGPRVVRVGSHALTATSKTTLWNRLSRHRGVEKSGGGNHRGSIFREIVGTALISGTDYELPTWGKGSSAPKDVRACEHAFECDVSKVIGSMPFLWLDVYDDPGARTVDPGKRSLRGYIECNTIALLSNFEKDLLDPPSAGWLGHKCDRVRVNHSGLWNHDHVDKSYDPAFLAHMAHFVTKMERAS